MTNGNLNPQQPEELKITKFGHACLRVDSGANRLVIDPGIFTDVEVAVAGAENILITHEHPDHIDDDRVLKHLAARHSVKLYGPPSVIDRLADRVDAGAVQIATDRLVRVNPEEEFELPGFSIRTVGGQHEVIHPQIPVVANIGYLINHVFYHPGDSFIVPAHVTPRTLCLPLNAPWAALEETLDFMIAVRPETVIPIHDALLGPNGHQVYLKQVVAFANKYNIKLELLEEGENLWS